MLQDRAATKAEEAPALQAAYATERTRFVDAGHHFMEYKVEFVRETLIGDMINTGKLEQMINQWAGQGWHVKSFTTAQVTGRVGAGGVDGIIVTFEWPVVR